jgi:hypothetical protein
VLIELREMPSIRLLGLPSCGKTVLRRQAQFWSLAASERL